MISYEYEYICVLQSGLPVPGPCSVLSTDLDINQKISVLKINSHDVFKNLDVSLRYKVTFRFDAYI